MSALKCWGKYKHFIFIFLHYSCIYIDKLRQDISQLTSKLESKHPYGLSVLKDIYKPLSLHHFKAREI